MRRLAVLALAATALALPGAASAQSPSPAASPVMVGVDTMHVCLAIRGPVVLLTPEVLTQGITDGTFVIEGLSEDCDTGTTASPEPMASPAASPAA
jgi:hypothetical protein